MTLKEWIGDLQKAVSDVKTGHKTACLIGTVDTLQRIVLKMKQFLLPIRLRLIVTAA
jgi:hypothetical protein